MPWGRKPTEPAPPAEWLIVGLGNPGAQYRGTRHNVGFEVVDILAQRHKLKVDKTRHRALTGAGAVQGIGACLAKPVTFMNLSGQAVAALAKSLGIKPDRILIIADDLDLPVGKVRLRPQGSSGGHNGHKSIIASLQTDSYPRIKIGISNAGETIDHVLGRFTPEERTDIAKALEASADAVEAILSDGLEAAMNRFNRA